MSERSEPTRSPKVTTGDCTAAPVTPGGPRRLPDPGHRSPGERGTYLEVT